MVLAIVETGQWNWVMFAYGVAYFVLVAYSVSVALRISRARGKLGEPS